MSVVRRSLLLATGESYITVAVGFVTLAIVSRLLTPEEIGIYALGAASMVFTLAMREFATAEFLVQRTSVTRTDIRTSFTILAIITAVIVGGIWIAAPWISAFYGSDSLARYLRVAVPAAGLELFALPVIALMRREMVFGRLAVIKVTAVVVSGTTACSLAWLGFSYMSFAWASLVSALATTVLALALRPDLSIFVPSLRSWRETLSFGGYNGMSIMLSKATESIPLFFLGRMMPVAAVGMYNRANLVCLMPDKVILSGVLSIALPALSKEVRAGSNLKAPYLRAITYLSAVYWPAQTLMLLLAHPVVSIILGDQWTGIVPLVQIIALATYFWAVLILTQPVLIAIGAFRHYMIASLITGPFTILVFGVGSYIGLEAFAASYLVALPVQLVVQQYFIRKHIDVRWSDLAQAVGKSAMVTAATALGPLGVIALAGFDMALSIPAFLVAGILGGVFWLAALYLFRHPFFDEICNLVGLEDRETMRLRIGTRLGLG